MAPRRAYRFVGNPLLSRSALRARGEGRLSRKVIRAALCDEYSEIDYDAESRDPDGESRDPGAN